MNTSRKPIGKISDKDIDRLLSHLDIPDNWEDYENDCWNCDLSKGNKGGHRHFGLNGRNVYAHRLMCVYNNHGYDPLHLDACHKCDNSQCCSPFHLSFDTRSQNQIDMVMRTTNHYKQKLKPEEVKEIKRLLSEGNLPKIRIAEQYGVSEATIRAIKTSKWWKHIQI